MKQTVRRRAPSSRSLLKRLFVLHGRVLDAFEADLDAREAARRKAQGNDADPRTRHPRRRR